MCFSMNEKWFLLSKSLGLAETKDILPGNPLYKQRLKVNEITYH